MLKLFKYISELFYPPKCVFCGKLLRQRPQDDFFVCPECSASVPRTALGGERKGNGFTACYSPLQYKGLVRDSLLRFKFSSRPGYSKTYAEYLFGCEEQYLKGRFDVITYAPVSRKRLRKRGYDQARLLAEETARKTGLPCETLLEKHRNTKKQSGMPDYRAREINIKGAYRAVNPEKISGRRILLIDDIITSGSTLSECAGILKAAGAREVLCMTLASK